MYVGSVRIRLTWDIFQARQKVDKISPNIDDFLSPFSSFVHKRHIIVMIRFDIIPVYNT